MGRWGILWKPMRCKLERVGLVVRVCMKLHNFIIDQGGSTVPFAEVYEDAKEGMRAPGREQRVRFKAVPRDFLNELPGRDNRVYSSSSESTRDYLLQHFSSLVDSGLVRPPRRDD